MSYKLLIVTKSALALRQAIQWLSQRNWDVQAIEDVKLAVAVLQKQKPDFVLIAADHPNRVVRELPKIVSSLSSAKMMAFVDEPTKSSNAQLNELGIKYLVQSPVSGPAIERTAIRLQKESGEAPVDEPVVIRGAEAAAKSEAVKVSGPSKFTGNISVEEFASFLDEQLLSLPDPRPKTAEPSPLPDEPKETGRPLLKPMPGAGADVTPTKIVIKGPSRPSGGEVKVASYRKDPASYPDRDSILVKGTEAVLDEVIQTIPAGKPGKTDEVETVTTVTNVVCLVVESANFRGHLIAAMGRDREMDANFMETAKQKLFEFLRSKGEKVSDADPVNLQLKPVDFEGWAMEQANFLRKSIQDNNEIAVAFFPLKEEPKKLQPSPAKDMVTMNLDDFKDDVQVDFDLYIHLPANNRYVLYTPGGKVLRGEQKSRLREKGVNQLHCKKDDAQEAAKYATQNALNEQIEALKGAQGENAAAGSPTQPSSPPPKDPAKAS